MISCRRNCKEIKGKSLGARKSVKQGKNRGLRDFVAAKHPLGTRVPFRSTVPTISQLRNGLRKWPFVMKTTFCCEIGLPLRKSKLPVIFLYFYKNLSFKQQKWFRKEEHQSNHSFALSPEPEAAWATGHHLWPFSSVRHGVNQRSEVIIFGQLQESCVKGAYSKLHIRASATSSRPTFGWTRTIESSGEALSDQIRWSSPAKETQGSRFRANRLNEALSRAVSSPIFRTSGGASAAHWGEFGLPGSTISLWVVLRHSHLQASARASRLIPSTT